MIARRERTFKHVREGQTILAFPEPGLSGLGDDAVGHGVGHALLPSLLEGPVDGVAVAVGALGDLCQGKPEALLVRAASAASPTISVQPT